MDSHISTDRDSFRSKALTHLGLAMALGGLGLNASGWSKPVIFAIAGTSAAFFLALLFHNTYYPSWLNRFTDRVASIPTNALCLFLGAVSLAIGLIEKGLVIEAIVTLNLAYIILGLWIGRGLGTALGDRFRRMRKAG